MYFVIQYLSRTIDPTCKIIGLARQRAQKINAVNSFAIITKSKVRQISRQDTLSIHH